MDPQGHRGDLGLAAVARRRAALARERAARAEAAAARNERLAEAPGREYHAMIAERHRRSAECHHATARLQDDFADRAAAWTEGGATRPRFMTVVAEACGTGSAAVALLDSQRHQLTVAGSDHRSRSAQDLEYVLDEGPGQDAATQRRAVHAAGSAIEERWPRYGPSLLSLGIASVSAVPLQTPDNCVGTLTVFRSRPAEPDPGRLSEVAAALTHIVLLDPDADPDLYGGADFRAVVHQAAGVLSVQLGHPVDDALALIKARAFAEEVSPDTIARRIMRGDREPSEEEMP
ncbi:GAF domain-containing protein [Streptomyces sp. CRN 30]|uniref:GAF domain-containing protein n=1 Tax=Streptomyces sp. CRN 30 TaxID=3075613 RepID=UPI002A82DED6|nr:GAF domain-containing protein [Streptomyces sp. CRN 30]